MQPAPDIARRLSPVAEIAVWRREEDPVKPPIGAIAPKAIRGGAPGVISRARMALECRPSEPAWRRRARGRWTDRDEWETLSPRTT